MTEIDWVKTCLTFTVALEVLIVFFLVRGVNRLDVQFRYLMMDFKEIIRCLKTGEHEPDKLSASRAYRELVRKYLGENRSQSSRSREALKDPPVESENRS